LFVCLFVCLFIKEIKSHYVGPKLLSLNWSYYLSSLNSLDYKFMPPHPALAPFCFVFWQIVWGSGKFLELLCDRWGSST
jgi:hypothetical protein